MSIHVTLLDNVFISQGVIKYYNICGTTLIRLKKEICIQFCTLGLRPFSTNKDRNRISQGLCLVS